MTKHNPKFTILIPVVKTRYFAEALESALAQTFDDYEIVVLDNKADADIAWAGEKPRTRYISNETRLAPAPNWNRGIENSRGDYIVLLCDDDILVPECLSEINTFLQKSNHNLDIVRFLRREFGGPIEQRWWGNFSCPGKEIETVDEYIYYQLKYFRGQALSDFVFSREAAKKVGGFPEMPGCLASDKSFVITLAALRNKIGNLNLPLLHYRWHSENYTTVPRPSLFTDSLDSDFFYFNLAARLLKGHEGQCVQRACAENESYWQIRQNTHFNDALRVFGWRGLFQIYKHAPVSCASKKKSLWLAIANKLRHFIMKRK